MNRTKSWILHGVMQEEAALPVTAEPHELVVASGLAALISPTALSSEADREEQAGEVLAAEAVRHHRLLTTYACSVDVLPIRFATLLASPADAVKILSKQASQHRKAIERIAGRAEYLVRLTWQEKTATAPEPPAGSYLRARSAQRRQQRLVRDQAPGFAADAAERLDALALAACDAGHRGGRLLDRAFLVSRSQAQAFVASAALLHERAATLDLKLMLSGPWPAYSFASQAEPAQ